MLHGTGEETFDAVKMLKAADPGKYTPAAGANYPKGRFGDSLRQLAQLIKANLGVQVAFADIGGWDHHVNEGATEGQLANVLTDFSQSLAAFWTDLGDLGEDTVVVTMSEFGRTARENGNRGTDHGHANVMFVLGGPVKGGKVYGRWPGLDQSQLYEGRDLALTTDFRQVIGEAVARHLGNKDLRQRVSRLRQPAREVSALSWLMDPANQAASVCSRPEPAKFVSGIERCRVYSTHASAARNVIVNPNQNAIPKNSCGESLRNAKNIPTIGRVVATPNPAP